MYTLSFWAIGFRSKPNHDIICARLVSLRAFWYVSTCYLFKRNCATGTRSYLIDPVSVVFTVLATGSTNSIERVNQNLYSTISQYDCITCRVLKEA